VQVLTPYVQGVLRTMASDVGSSTFKTDRTCQWVLTQ